MLFNYNNKVLNISPQEPTLFTTVTQFDSKHFEVVNIKNLVTIKNMF